MYTLLTDILLVLSINWLIDFKKKTWLKVQKNDIPTSIFVLFSFKNTSNVLNQDAFSWQEKSPNICSLVLLTEIFP